MSRKAILSEDLLVNVNIISHFFSILYYLEITSVIGLDISKYVLMLNAADVKTYI